MQDWKPLYPAHAIQQVSAGIRFQEALPERPWRRMLTLARELGRDAGLITEHPIHQFTFPVDVDPSSPSGAVAVEVGLEMLRFERPDFYSEKLTVQKNYVQFENWLYTRWAGYGKQLSDFVAPLASIYSETLIPTEIYIEYVDRFDAKQAGSSPKCDQVIKAPSSIIPERAFSNDKPWHCHIGYFETPEGKPWRLVNVDVDVADLTQPVVNETLRAIRIRTRMGERFDLSPAGSQPEGALTKDFVVERFDILHIELKALLGTILTQEASGEISLQG